RGLDRVSAAIRRLDHLVTGVIDGEDVVAVATGHLVGADPAVDRVVALAAVDRVVAFEAVDDVVAVAAVERVVLLVAGDGVAAAAFGICDHCAVRDGEASGNAALPGDIAAGMDAEGGIERGVFEIDGDRLGGIGAADRVGAAGVPDAGPAGAGLIHGRQEVRI